VVRYYSSYSGGAWLKSRPKDWLFWKISQCSSVLPSKLRDRISNRPSSPIPYSFWVHYSSYQSKLLKLRSWQSLLNYTHTHTHNHRHTHTHTHPHTNYSPPSQGMNSCYTTKPPGDGKGARCVELTLPPSSADCEPQPPAGLRACRDCLYTTNQRQMQVPFCAKTSSRLVTTQKHTNGDDLNVRIYVLRKWAMTLTKFRGR
jgi:hypothetical protein